MGGQTAYDLAKKWRKNHYSEELKQKQLEEVNKWKSAFKKGGEEEKKKEWICSFDGLICDKLENWEKHCHFAYVTGLHEEDNPCLKVLPESTPAETAETP